MNYFLDPEDPFPDGYVVADTWGVSTLTRQDSTPSLEASSETGPHIEKPGEFPGNRGRRHGRA